MTTILPPPDQLLAVYGTLRRGHDGQRRAGVAGRLAYRGPCVLAGALYDLGAYPGFVEGESGEVVGELFHVPDPATLARLDAYEGADAPADPEYARRRVRLRAPAGVGCWAYVYLRPVAGRAPIPGGDWGRHAAQSL